MIGWNFPPNNDGIASGVNDGALDTFSGRRLSFVVREIIQNSMDAKNDVSAPVRVHFSVEKVSAEKFSGFSDIKLHIESCAQIAKKQKLPDAVKFYEHALNKIEISKFVNVLCIHDENTSGLTGPLDKPWGSWFAITKGAGVSQKSNSSSLGSFGHGSKAPFAFSDTRTVFYLSRLQDNKNIQTRFQGKCILQTHMCPYENVLTQGTGFFGKKVGNMPLLDDEVPSWAQALRDKNAEGFGTSIFVPYTSFNTELYIETKLIVLANFFYAIMSNELEVIVGDDLITRSNLEEVYNECLSAINTMGAETDGDYVRECFESIKTILDYDHHNAQEIIGFGKILWWLRSGDRVGHRAVGIARQNGMLITKKATGLERFRGTKNFDLFVCVKGEKGSQLLRKLENPTHDNFEFDRIKFQKEKTSAKKKYRVFTSKVREVIEMHASVARQIEEDVEGLSFIFGEIREANKTSKIGTERGDKLTLNSYGFNNKKSQLGDEKGLDYIEDLFALRNQKHRTKPKIKHLKSKQTVELIGKVADNDTNKNVSNIFDAINLRVIHRRENKAYIYFNSENSGSYNMQIFAVGELGSAALEIIIDNKKCEAIKLDLIAGKRNRLELEFVSDATNYVLEAKLNEI